MEGSVGLAPGLDETPELLKFIYKYKVCRDFTLIWQTDLNTAQWKIIEKQRLWRSD